MKTEAFSPTSEDEVLRIREAKKIIEALLFASPEPLAIQKIISCLSEFHPFTQGEIKRLLEELRIEYQAQGRSFCLEHLAEGYALHSDPEFSPYIEKLLAKRRAEKLSGSALEVLSIIAYRQPITRPKIDQIRGVDSSGILGTLQERGLVEATGTLEVPGRPTLWGTTQEFLRYFGIRDLSELPKIDQLR